MGGLALNVQHCRRPLGSKTDPEQVFQLELLLASSLFVKLVPLFHFENFFTVRQNKNSVLFWRHEKKSNETIPNDQIPTKLVNSLKVIVGLVKITIVREPIQMD